MTPFPFQRRCIVTTAMAFYLLFFHLSPETLGQESVSKYSPTAEPSVKLGPWAGSLDVGPGMNAAGKCLKGCQFIGQDLQGAVFDGCDLDGAEFYRCDLSNASFRGTHMTGMLFGRSKISGADFTDATINGIKWSPPKTAFRLARIHLSPEQLVSTRSYKKKSLSKCVIYAFKENISEPPASYDFRNAILFEASLRGDFRECDFTDASITGARLGKCTITADQLESTRQFKRRRLHRAGLDGTRIKGALDLSGMELLEIHLRGAFTDINLDDANISKAAFNIAKRHLARDKKSSPRRFIKHDVHRRRLYWLRLLQR